MKQIYVRLELKTENILESCRKRLEGLGAECIMEAMPYQAYCIVNNEHISIVKFDPDIITAFPEEPPCGK